MTPEQIEDMAITVVHGFRGDHYWIDKAAAVGDVVAAIRAAIQAEREGCIQAVSASASTIATDSTNYYEGYKEAIQNAVASIRARGE